jgi:2-hydroxycyclohexanecarboxyl-CoA dehydrogenase
MVSGVDPSAIGDRIQSNAAGFDEPFMSNDDDFVDGSGGRQLHRSGAVVTWFLTPIVAAERTVEIVNMASDTGRVESMDETVYSGTEGGLIFLTKSLPRGSSRWLCGLGVVACPRADSAELRELHSAVLSCWFGIELHNVGSR